MSTITLFHNRESAVSILAWGGSLILHGLFILGTLTFLTQVTPTPAPKLLQWKVSLLTPAPSSELSEHAQTVKHSLPPTTRSTVSRPQPKRHLSPERRIQQRQPPIHETAVVTRPSSQPIKTSVLTRTTRSHPTPSPRSRQKHVATIQTTTAPSRQAMSTPRVMAKASSRSKKQHLNRTAATQTVTFAQPQVISSTVEAHSSPSIRQAEPTRISTNARAIIHTRTHEESKRIDVPHPISAPTPIHTSFQQFTKFSSRPTSGNLQQRSETSMTRSHASHHTTSAVTKRVAPVVKQPAIFAGAPNRQTTQKLHHRTKLASISREAMQSRQKLHSDNSQISKGLSKEVLAFLKLLREKIEQHRQYPRMAKRLGYQGTTTVSFALSHAGKLTLLKIAEPSGHTILDEAALEAVQSISSLKPPMTIRGTPIEIPVAFKLTR